MERNEKKLLEKEETPLSPTPGKGGSKREWRASERDKGTVRFNGHRKESEGTGNLGPCEKSG